MNITRNLLIAVLMTIATTILLGLVYPLAMTAIAQAIFPDKANGQLVHSVPEGKMLLTYRVVDDVIITDQPSHPREARTRFSFDPDGSLVLVTPDGQHARFLKQLPAGH